MAGAEGNDTSAMLQLVNYNEEVATNTESYWRELMTGKDEESSVRMVAIMGPQSSGKSTILNRLFGTQFRTMDEDEGRYQVTEGIWLGAEKSSGLAVIDLEGTDSRERGEDSVVYERKSALFALAVSEVLIINLWTQDVGRLNASNLLLLRIVLEQDLVLFHNDDKTATPMKTRLFFLFRDHDLTTPLPRLSEPIETDLQKIWAEITSATKHEGSQLSEYFDLDFFALPHKVLMPEQFESACAELHTKFHSNTTSLFQSNYDRGVTVDGFPVFAKNVWETIRSERELNLPAQKELVALVRCDEFKKYALAQASASFSELKAVVDNASATDAELAEVPKGLEKAKTEALSDFDESARRYPDKAAVKKNELTEEMESTALEIYQKLTDRLTQELSEKVGEDLRKLTSWEGFGKGMDVSVDAAMKRFETICSSESGFLLKQYDLTKGKLKTSLGSQTQRWRDSATKSSQEQLRKSYSAALVPPVSMTLDRVARSDPSAVWKQIGEIASENYKTIKAEAIKRFGDDGLGLDAAATDAATASLKKSCEEETSKQLRGLLGLPSMFSTRSKQTFYALFRNDEHGLPRVWGADDDITEAYDAALEKAVLIAQELTVVQLFDLEDTSTPLTSVKHFTPEQIDEIKEALEKEARAAYAESKRSQESMKAQMLGIQGKLPVWVVAALILVGLDDAVWVFKNPVLLMLCIILSIVGYVGYVLNLHIFLKDKFRRDMNDVLLRTKRALDVIATDDVTTSAATADSTASMN